MAGRSNSPLRVFLVGSLLCAGLPSVRAQLIIDQTHTPTFLLENILQGTDVSVTNVTFNGVEGVVVPDLVTPLGQIGRFDGTNTCLGVDSGVFLCTDWAAYHLPGPNDQLMQSGGALGGAGAYPTPDLDLSHASGWHLWYLNNGTNIFGKSVLEFDFIPQNDLVSLRYVFSSEEYEHRACGEFVDVFGFFISGPGIPVNINGPFSDSAMNMALVPGSLRTVGINSVNSGAQVNNMNGHWGSLDPFEFCVEADPDWQSNTPYYRYNGGEWPTPGMQFGPQQEAPYNADPYYLQHNGMTVVLTADAAVQIGETYRVKLAIGNVQDQRYPSALFLEAGSFACDDRFTLTVDEAPNVDLTGPVPVLYQSPSDSVYLRFHRWGGRYLDEHLQLVVGGDAMADLHYAPGIPDSLHFQQLVPSVVFPIAVPVVADSVRELLIDLISSNGDKVMSYTLLIDGNIPTDIATSGPPVEAPILFPSPTDGLLQVVLPSNGMEGTDLQVIDLAGRVVLQQRMNGTPRTTLDVSSLPNGLYVLKTMAEGRTSAARFHVRH